MKKLIFIRHGSTAGNLERRYIGRTDEPLCSRGRSQAERLAAEQPWADMIFVSPARRTVETAQIVFPGRDLIPVSGLWETDFGLFEARTGDELWENCPEYRTWVEGNCLGPVPGGEAIDRFKDRCCEAFLDCLARVPDGQTAAFVIHGGCIMAILERYARPQKRFYDYHISNGKVLEATEETGVLTLR